MTDIARSWLEQTFPNHGFYVTVPEQGNTVGCQFASIDHPDSSIHPRLYVEYHAGVGVEEVEPEVTLEASTLSVDNVAISFWLANPTPISLRVYDVSGTLVETLADEPLNPGNHHLTWTGDAAGVYFVRLVTPGRILTEKLTLIK